MKAAVIFAALVLSVVVVLTLNWMAGYKARTPVYPVGQPGDPVGDSQPSQRLYLPDDKTGRIGIGSTVDGEGNPIVKPIVQADGHDWFTRASTGIIYSDNVLVVPDPPLSITRRLAIMEQRLLTLEKVVLWGELEVVE